MDRGGPAVGTSILPSTSAPRAEGQDRYEICRMSVWEPPGGPSQPSSYQIRLTALALRARYSATERHPRFLWNSTEQIERGRTRERSKERKRLKEGQCSRWKRMRIKAGGVCGDNIRRLEHSRTRDTLRSEEIKEIELFNRPLPNESPIFSKADPAQKNQVLLPLLWHHLSL